MATRTAAITTVSSQRPRLPFKVSRVLFLTVALIFTALALAPGKVSRANAYPAREAIAMYTMRWNAARKMLFRIHCGKKCELVHTST